MAAQKNDTVYLDYMYIYIFFFLPSFCLGRMVMCVITWVSCDLNQCAQLQCETADQHEHTGPLCRANKNDDKADKIQNASLCLWLFLCKYQ